MTVHTAQRPFDVAKEVARLARAILGEGTSVVRFGSWVQGAAAARSDLDQHFGLERRFSALSPPLSDPRDAGAEPSPRRLPDGVRAPRGRWTSKRPGR